MAALVLVLVGFLDELGSGVTPVGAADIRDELGLAYGGAGLVLLVAPLLLSLVIEGPLLLLSDRWRRDRMAGIGMLVAGLCMLGAAAAESGWVLALALGGWSSAGGVASGVAEGVLMDSYPDERERWLTRENLMGALGDAAAPGLLLACAALGWGWREALVAAAVLHFGHALALGWAIARAGPAGEDGQEDEADERDPPLLERLRAGLRDRELLAWLLAAALCCLLDEILVAFGAMFLRDELGAGVSTQVAAFTAWALGGALGLALCDRLLRRVDPLRLLLLSALACALVFCAWLLAPSIASSVACLALVGACGAPLYPICLARAYAARPGEAGLVAAVDELFGPISILAPLVIGLLADRFGVAAALWLLLAQPVGVGLIGLSRLRITARSARRGSRRCASRPP